MRYLAAIIALFVTSGSFAIDVTPSAVPKNLHVYNSAGSTYVDLVGFGCSGARYFLSPNHPKYDAIVAVLLAAQMAGREVSLRFDGCINEGNPQGNVIGVYLK